MDTDPSTSVRLAAEGFVPLPGDAYGGWLRVDGDPPTEPDAFRDWLLVRFGHAATAPDAQVWWPTDVAATAAADRYEQEARRVIGEVRDALVAPDGSRTAPGPAFQKAEAGADAQAEAFRILARIARAYAAHPEPPTAMR